ncbi:MAG: acetylglutamate kinase [Clostridiales bacterium GWF2_38_85]|nr:MAG: acetylglutamate kinase [Clostridiales bacterium GWF2_38_85]HBL84974.1 acetylglutamate kinase [Clostridiales bacterium]
MYRKNNHTSYDQQYLINKFRQLWEQHVMWTRSFIISTASDLGDLQVVTERLLKNPGDFATVLQRFYGLEKAKGFETLFTDHLVIAADLVNHAKTGDQAAVDADRVLWYKNADDISEYLSKINPNWSKKEWQKMFYSHLKMTENEAAKRLTGKFAEDIAEYEMIENEALTMADYIAEGIIKQFES